MSVDLECKSQRSGNVRNDRIAADLLEGRAVHFVRFRSTADQRFANAVRIFGRPDFLHRLWDARAFREIADGDTVIFAEGDFDQPVAEFNGDDEHYEKR